MTQIHTNKRDMDGSEMLELADSIAAEIERLDLSKGSPRIECHEEAREVHVSWVSSEPFCWRDIVVCIYPEHGVGLTQTLIHDGLTKRELMRLVKQGAALSPLPQPEDVLGTCKEEG